MNAHSGLIVDLALATSTLVLVGFVVVEEAKELREAWRRMFPRNRR